jgi:chemotaxis protein MotB
MSDMEEQGGFEEPTAPAWMATFGDLMSLLLTFFVLLMSFASMDVRKFAAIAGSMRDAFGVQTIHAGLVESLSDSVVRLSDVEATPMIRVLDLPKSVQEREQSLLERLRRAIEARELQRVVQAEKSPRGVVLRMGGQLLFSAGSADLRPEAVVFLGEIARLINSVPGPISVEGHTDSTQATGASELETNWALSAQRAVIVVRHLAEAEGIRTDRLRATAFGDTRPLVPNADAEGRAMNRRVEFVFLRSEIDLDADVWMEGGPKAAARAASSSEGDES